MSLALAGLLGGTGLGAIAGGIGAGMEADRNRDYYNDLASRLQGLQGQVQNRVDQRVDESQKAYAPLLKGFENNAQDYYSALGNADFNQFNMQGVGDFEYDMNKATQEALNPMLGAIIDRSTGAVMQNAVTGSGVHGGGALKGIARATADIQANEYGRAQNVAQQNRANKYQEFMDRFNTSLQANQMNANNLQNTLGAKGTLFNAQSNLFGNQRQEQTGYQNAGDQSYFDLAGQQQQAQAQANSQPSFWGAFGQGALSGASGGLQGGAELYKALK